MHSTTNPATRLAALVMSSALLLAVVLGFGQVGPARAEPPVVAPDNLPDAISLKELRSLPALQVSNAHNAPLGEPGEPAGDGYLFAQVYDLLSRRLLGDRSVNIYNRDQTFLAQKTLTCSGYVEFPNLAYGAYRVMLEEDPDWVTVARNGASEWYLVRPYWRVAVRFFVIPNIQNAGLRVYAYSPFSRQAGVTREPVAGAAFEVYDSSGNLVATDVTGCGGFADFDLAPGTYRVVDANAATGVYRYPPSGQRWVTARFGWLSSTWFFTVAGPAPEGTSTPEP
jgi:hypothetical protein